MLLLNGFLHLHQQLLPPTQHPLLITGIKGHLPAGDGVHQHLEEDDTQAPHVIGCVVHDRGGQVGDGCNELRGAVLGGAVLVQPMLCSSNNKMCD